MRHRDQARFHRMFELAMRSFRPHLDPAFTQQPFDDVATDHEEFVRMVDMFLRPAKLLVRKFTLLVIRQCSSAAGFDAEGVKASSLSVPRTGTALPVKAKLVKTSRAGTASGSGLGTRR